MGELARLAVTERGENADNEESKRPPEGDLLRLRNLCTREARGAETDAELGGSGRPRRRCSYLLRGVGTPRQRRKQKAPA